MGGIARRARRVTAAVVLAVLTMAGLALTASPSAHALAVYPIVECVSTTSSGYTAVFGYNNQTGTTQTLPIGTLNNFLPTPQNRGQPTTFNAGRYDNLFSASWTGSSGYVYWDLNNQNGAVANSGSPACTAPPVPIWGSQPLLWTVVFAAGALGVAAFGRRRFRRRASARPV